MMSSNNKVAIIIDDLTEFFVMQPAIDAIKNHNIPIDIIVPYDSGYNDLPKHTIKKIKELGYLPKNDVPKNNFYKILLTPYPCLNIIDRINYCYHIRYPYGAATTKPNPVFLPEWKIHYDAIISFNTSETRFLDAYGANCHTVPHWNYHNFKKKKHSSDKPTLLILPTFGNQISCINLFTKSAIEEIKKEYRIITKAHHATHFGDNGKTELDLLQSFSDEAFDSDTPITKLLQIADLVLSDNSGAIFEAICADVPVALFAKNFNIAHLDKINTLQYQMIAKGIIPSVNHPNEILPMLQSIKPFIPKQQHLKQELFLPIPSKPFEPFISIINDYLKRNPDDDYRKILHNLMLSERHEHIETIASLRRQMELEATEKDKRIKELENVIQALRDSTSWKITKPLRAIKKITERR